MADKYIIGLPPRQGKTVTMEMLKEINMRDRSFTIPVENVTVDSETIRKLCMPPTKLKCPECEGTLYFDHETETEIILYCIHCDKKVKAKKG